MYYVYIIKRNNDPYIGYTNNLKRRVAQHEKNYKNVKLVYYESYGEKSLAMKRERSLKQFGGAWRSLRKRLEITISRGRGDDFQDSLRS